jgi:hypothetical protein
MASAIPAPVPYGKLYSDEVTNKFGGKDSSAQDAGAAALANHLSRQPHTPKTLGHRLGKSYYDEFATSWASMPDKAKYEALTLFPQGPFDPPEINVGVSNSDLAPLRTPLAGFRDFHKPFFAAVGRPLFGAVAPLHQAKKQEEEGEKSLEALHDNGAESMDRYVNAVVKRLSAAGKA